MGPSDLKAIFNSVPLWRAARIRSGGRSPSGKSSEGRTAGNSGGSSVISSSSRRVVRVSGLVDSNAISSALPSPRLESNAAREQLALPTASNTSSPRCRASIFAWMNAGRSSESWADLSFTCAGSLLAASVQRPTRSGCNKTDTGTLKRRAISLSASPRSSK